MILTEAHESSGQNPAYSPLPIFASAPGGKKSKDHARRALAQPGADAPDGYSKLASVCSRCSR